MIHNKNSKQTRKLNELQLNTEHSHVIKVFTIIDSIYQIYLIFLVPIKCSVAQLEGSKRSLKENHAGGNSFNRSW